MRSPEEIADELGRAKIAKAVGVRPSAVSNAIRRGVFPAAWRASVERLAEQSGVEVCAEAFYVNRGAA